MSSWTATDKKRSKLVSEPNYHTMNYISEDLSTIEMRKTKVKMNKPIIYLGLSILEISKILMYKFWYDYMKRKYGKDVKLCYTDTKSSHILKQVCLSMRDLLVCLKG